MSDRVRTWCLRHAESENVTTGTAGAVPAAPLTARGRHQARDAARILADEPITRVYSSTAHDGGLPKDRSSRSALPIDRY